MAFESVDALKRDTLYYACDPGGSVVGIAWYGGSDASSTAIDRAVRLWERLEWTVAHVHRDQAAPVLSAFQAHKKESEK